MVQLSPNPLPQALQQSMWHMVERFMGVNQQGDNAQASELFSSTEQSMLANRLIANVLLVHGWNPYQVSSVLSMSSATLYKLKDQLEYRPDFKQFLIQQFPSAPTPPEGNQVVPPAVDIINALVEIQKHHIPVNQMSLNLPDQSKQSAATQPTITPEEKSTTQSASHLVYASD